MFGEEDVQKVLASLFFIHKPLYAVSWFFFGSKCACDCAISVKLSMFHTSTERGVWMEAEVTSGVMLFLLLWGSPIKRSTHSRRNRVATYAGEDGDGKEERGDELPVLMVRYCPQDIISTGAANVFQ